MALVSACFKPQEVSWNWNSREPNIVHFCEWGEDLLQLRTVANAHLRTFGPFTPADLSKDTLRKRRRAGSIKRPYVRFRSGVDIA